MNGMKNQSIPKLSLISAQTLSIRTLPSFKFQTFESLSANSSQRPAIKTQISHVPRCPRECTHLEAANISSATTTRLSHLYNFTFTTTEENRRSYYNGTTTSFEYSSVFVMANVSWEVSVKIAFTELAVVAARLKYAEVVSNVTFTKECYGKTVHMETLRACR
ncbi:jg20182 [Pararge aegeria aegeria]|uniref:Jg20182 protein n=1 Tax=Pararge aegeria aegeria TaxID=348720 RepID=A0A8S4S477_9NEOP|nr:jg20182 [Pararge aegeria aegeria]